MVRRSSDGKFVNGRPTPGAYRVSFDSTESTRAGCYGLRNTTKLGWIIIGCHLLWASDTTINELGHANVERPYTYCECMAELSFWIQKGRHLNSDRQPKNILFYSILRALYFPFVNESIYLFWAKRQLISVLLIGANILVPKNPEKERNWWNIEIQSKYCV